MEEAAAREVQSSRFGEMDPEDFSLPDDEVQDSTMLPDDKSKLNVGKSLVKLTPKQRQKYLRLHHPELIPITSHFSDKFTRFYQSDSEFRSGQQRNSQGEFYSCRKSTSIHDRPRQRSQCEP